MRLRDLRATFNDALLEAALDPARLDAWHAWRVWKSFVQLPVSDADGDAFRVTLGRAEPDDGLVHLVYSRHLAVADEEDYNLVGELFCDLGYDPEPALDGSSLELHEADFPTFADFVAAVESNPAVQAAFAREPVGSTVTIDR